MNNSIYVLTININSIDSVNWRLIIIEKHYEVIKKVLELLDTIEEGFEHVQKHLIELQYENAFVVMNDIIQGISSIGRAIQPMMDKLPQNDINTLLGDINKGMKKVVSNFEQGKEVNIQNQIVVEILPAFNNWKNELEKILKPYLSS